MLLLLLLLVLVVVVVVVGVVCNSKYTTTGNKQLVLSSTAISCINVYTAGGGVGVGVDGVDDGGVGGVVVGSNINARTEVINMTHALLVLVLVLVLFFLLLFFLVV